MENRKRTRMVGKPTRVFLSYVRGQWPGNHCCTPVEGMAAGDDSAALQAEQKKRELKIALSLRPGSHRCTGKRVHRL